MAKKERSMEQSEALSAGNDAKLLERITEDAKNDASVMLAEAESKVKLIREETDKKVAEILLGGEQAAQRAENDILIRSRTNAELDARKAALAARCGVIEKTKQDVLARLYGMKDDEAEEFFFNLLVRETVGGETVCPAEKHVDVIKKAVEKASEFLVKQGYKPLTVGEASGYHSGFALVGNGYMKHCSFESMLSEFFERELSVVAAMLFND